jgi:hypothetical protein
LLIMKQGNELLLPKKLEVICMVTGMKRKCGNVPSLVIMSFFIIGMVALVGAQPTQKGTARVYGSAHYLVGSHDYPIRLAKVELYEDSIIDTKIATTTTNDGGDYEFIVMFTGTKNVYARVCCESVVARVTGGILGNVYSYKTPTATAYEGGTAFLGHYYASTEDLYWSALDHATAEYLWMGLQVGWTRSQVEIKYPKGNKPISYGDIIELPDRNTWNWGRPEVLHEYAHCIMYELYHGFPPGSCADSCQCPQGNHYYNSVSDKGFAFTEGWAQFMQCAVDNNPTNAYLHNLGDVDGNGVTNYLATNIEDNTYTVFVNGREYRYKWYHGRCFPADHNGNRVEGAVAGIQISE